MKRLVLPLVIFSALLTACSYSGKILIADDIAADSQRGRYELKTAIVITQHQKSETMNLHSGGYSVNITPYPNLYRMMQASMKRVFSEVEIVEEKDFQRGKYDISIYTKSNAYFNAQFGGGTFVSNVSTMGYDVKGDELFRTSSQETENYSTPTGAAIASFFTGFTLFLASPVTIPLTTYSIGTYAEKTITEMLSKSIDETTDSLLSSPKLEMLANRDKYKLKDEESSVTQTVKSDIEDLPPSKAKLKKNAFAIVIGIEKYRQKLPKADYAVADAKTVTEYLTKVMGYPEENVVTLTNDHAAKSDFEKYFEKWLSNNVEKDSTVFIYFSGHGAPNPKTGAAFLVPFDGDPNFIDQTGYSLIKLYDALGKLQAKEIIVALDSCFSGAGGRSVLGKGARPLVMNLQNNVILSKNMTVMSASSGEQISSTYDEKGHGLFTYFMLKGIKNEDVTLPDGSIKIDDLFGYIKPQVERIARKQYNNEQTPQLIEPKK